MNFELRQKLEQVARRIRSLRLWSALALCWLFWTIVGLLVYERSSSLTAMSALQWNELAVLAGASAVVTLLVTLFSARDPRAVARRVEARHPDLGTLLLAALETSRLPRERLGFLQATVIRDAVAHGRRHDWANAVSPWKLRFARLASLTALGLLIGVCIGLANRADAEANGMGTLASLGDLRDVLFDIKVDPGNTEIERGTSLIVLAEFGAAVPPEATLVISDRAGGQHPEAMVRSLEDPKFVGRVPVVENDLSYHVEYAGRQSEKFRVKVFDYPELVRADAKLVYPEYTSMEPTIVEDVRHVTAVEGTKLTFAFRLNKPVSTARLVDADGAPVELQQSPEDATLYRTSWTLDESRRFKLQLEDEDGRQNRLPPDIVVKVTPNRPPEIEFQRPARDVEVSPLEELQLKATVTDDFGVTANGMTYSLGGAAPRNISLTDTTQPAKQRDIAHLLELEALNAQQDQLLTYFIWAEDIGPDGKPRRTASDMYFAEVRPFEEIFRQGEQPAQSQQQQGQQGGGNAQEAAELAELQKQIINATWKLVRRETGATTTAEFPADTRIVEESQQSAIEQLNRLAERVEDSESITHVDAARDHMQEARKQLASATQSRNVKPLQPALSSEQAAYQALLKLRAREHQVVRGGQQQGGGQQRSGSRSQRQLNQLELRADENRYETQSRAANPEETAAQQQSREILNRLRDLARRQEDINERLRELQSALEQAQTDQQREEIKRELKRLRDQQQQVLRDTDELAGRMDQRGNQRQSQEARQQLNESRSRVQRASEALEQGQLSQALTEGTRAGRQLSELRDQFRRQAANRFSEEMTEMRRTARNLDERQQQLSNRLNEEPAAPGRSLRDTGPRAEVAEGLAEQRRELRDLLQRMRQTIEEAEEPEPLLSQQLYDTVRDAHHQRVENALDVARRLAEVGIEREAGRAMQAADQGISRLREGVERAAESVLGDETEALRRAQSEVERLAEELNREIQNADGTASSESAEQHGSESESQQGRNQAADAARRQNQAVSRDGQSENPDGRDSEQLSQSDENGQSPQDAARNGRAQSNEDTSSGNRRGQAEARGNRGSNDDQQREGGSEAGARSQQNDQEGRADAQQRENSNGRPSDSDAPDNPQRSALRGSRGQSNERGGGFEQFFEQDGGGGPGAPGGPITGEDFRDWADRLRDVEQMLDDEDLRSEAARIRDRAEDARIDFKRHAKIPNWTRLQDLVADPLLELSRRINEEIRRSESPDAMVPIDRDPVPPEFADEVRRYYERLGGGK
jgi:hypothetical protein